MVTVFKAFPLKKIAMIVILNKSFNIKGFLKKKKKTELWIKNIILKEFPSFCLILTKLPINLEI